MDPLIYNPKDPETVRNPYPVLLALQESDPVHWSPSLKAWILTRYEDARWVLNASQMSVDRIEPFYKKLPQSSQKTLAEIVHYLNLWLVFRDPPEHTRLRQLIGRAFTMAAVENLRDGIEEIASMLLDRLPRNEPVDFVAEFAMPLPALVIMDLLGVPREAMSSMKDWSDEMQLFIGSAQNSADKYERAAHGAHEMAAFFSDLIAKRRSNPKDDLISKLITARDEHDALSNDELVAACMLVLFGGHETTTNLLSTGLYKFITHADARTRLAADPSLINRAVEECLRLDGPTGSMARLVAQEHELHGKQLAPGERVFAMLNAANQDPRVFDRPQEFDITRLPNRHLSLGYGTHFCMGAALARLEGEISFMELVRRFPEMTLDDAEPIWHDTMIMRGFKNLPVRLG